MKLDESGQFVNFTSALKELDPDSCSLGFTIQFDIKFISTCGYGIFLSTQGAIGNKAGLAVSLCEGNVFVSIKTMHKEWSVKAGHVSMDK